MRTLKFVVELEFPGDLAVDPTMLIDTIQKALLDYDADYSLLPGIKTPDSGRRLVGTSAEFVASRVEADILERYPRVLPPPGLRHTEQERCLLTSASFDLDYYIADLEALRVRIWKAYDELLWADSEQSLSAARTVSEAAVEAARQALQAVGKDLTGQ